MGMHETLRALTDEASATSTLIENLKRIGSDDEVSIDISVESETNFKEVVEKILVWQMEAAADIAKMDAMIKTLSDRKSSYKKSNDSIRDLLSISFLQANVKSLKTAFGTVTLKDASLEAEIVNEAEAPLDYFVVPEPVLDASRLRKDAISRFKIRAAAIEAAMNIVHPGERDDVLARIDRDMPAIPGVRVSSGRKSLVIRRS